MATSSQSAEPVSDRHRNEVILVGELAAAPQARTMPSGDEVLAFRITVRSGAPPGRPARSAAAARTSATSRLRSDSLECAAWRGELRARLQGYRVGDLLEVTGALRHRYWRGAAGLASRYEVEADRIRVVAKAPPSQRGRAQSSIPP